MIGVATLFPYMAVVLGLFLIPGPAVILVLTRSTAGGPRVGVATGLGVACGDLLHTLLATIGLSAILMTSTLAFSVVKYVGVFYLIYLGIRSIFENDKDLDIGVGRRVAVSHAFGRAILAELLNPKTALFFLAFLPQFVDQHNGSVGMQLAILGLIFAGMGALYSSLLALAAGQVGNWLKRHRGIGRWQGRAVGTIYLALGARLAFQGR